MTPSAVSTDLKQLRAAMAFQRYVIGGLTAALVLCLLAVISLVGRERTVLVPPVIEKSFWVTHNRVSPSYLEQMAAFVTYLTLDVSPQSVEWKKNLLLQYVSPDYHGPLQARQQLEATRLKQMNATTQFSLSRVVPDEKGMSVRVAGKLATFINGQRTTDVLKTYQVQFDYSGNRIHLKKFEEIQSEAELAISDGGAGVAAAGVD